MLIGFNPRHLSPPSFEQDFLQLSNKKRILKRTSFILFKQDDYFLLSYLNHVLNKMPFLLFCMLDCTSLDAWQFIIKRIIGPLWYNAHTYKQATLLPIPPKHLHRYSVKNDSSEYYFKISLGFTFLGFLRTNTYLNPRVSIKAQCLKKIPL